MIDFLWGLAGALVAMVIVSVVLRMLLRALTAPASLRPSTGDKVIGFVIGVITIVLLSGLTRAVFGSDPSPFVEQLSLGAGLAVVFDSPDFIALALRHRATERTPPRRTDPVVPPVRFSEAVRAHFADPEVRARYVVAAYREGLIPADDVPGLAAELAPFLPGDAVAWRELASGAAAGLDGALDGAAREIGYAPTLDQARADAVERLVYAALCGDDPRTRLATAEALGLPMSESASPRPEARRARAVELRVLLADSLAARHGPALPEAVQRHFTGASGRARALVAEYRHGLLVSPRLPQAAAEIVAELPGEAWTELAMAAPDAPRSELLPVLDRAAAEIAYAPTEREAEIDVLEAATYRAVVDGRVVRESSLLHRLEFHGDREDYPSELQLLRDAWFLSDDGEELLASVRSRLIDYLTARYA